MGQIGQVESKASRKQTAEIVAIIEEKIRKGEYPVGAKLPTVRKLAEEFGVDKNTTARAYQALRRKGYLDLIRGSGAIVRRRELVNTGLDEDWEDRLERVVVEGRRRGMSRETLLERMRASTDRVFYPSHLRICFIECNIQDIESMTAELRVGVGHPMEGILLSEVITRPEEISSRYDLIVTSFFHLNQVIRALGAETEKQVVGVNSIPDHAALLTIARLHSPVIGLVCELPDVMETLTHIIRTYHASATIIPALFEEESRLKALLEKADAVVVPIGVSKRLLTLNPSVPVITVAFTIERQSIDFLANRIKELENHQRNTSSA